MTSRSSADLPYGKSLASQGHCLQLSSLTPNHSTDSKLLSHPGLSYGYSSPTPFGPSPFPGGFAETIQPLYGMTSPHPLTSPHCRHIFSCLFFLLSDPTWESNPFELLFSKLSQLEYSVMDLHATYITQKGPTIKSWKPVASPPNPERCSRIANVTDCSEEESSVPFHSSLCPLSHQ